MSEETIDAKVVLDDKALEKIAEKLKEKMPVQENKEGLVENLKKEYGGMNPYGKAATWILVPIVLACFLRASCNLATVQVPRQRPSPFVNGPYEVENKEAPQKQYNHR